MYQKIKKVIFDVDNTLIMWQDEYLNAVKQAVEEYHLNCHYKDIDAILNKSELLYGRYDINLIINLIKQDLGLTVSREFIETWLYYLGFMSKEDPKVNEILEYLRPKYKLAALSNCFEFVQTKRLETAGMRAYFNEVIGGDRYVKPDPRAFMLAIGNYKPEECLMIGDNYELDYLAAKEAGLQALHLSPKECPEPYVRIRSLNDLKKFL